MGQMIVFNRRRQGEVSKMLISYVMHANRENIADIHDMLSPVEKALLQFFIRIEIPGKRGNVVPVFLTNQKQSIDILIHTEKRQYAVLKWHDSISVHTINMSMHTKTLLFSEVTAECCLFIIYSFSEELSPLYKYCCNVLPVMKISAISTF